MTDDKVSEVSKETRQSTKGGGGRVTTSRTRPSAVVAGPERTTPGVTPASLNRRRRTLPPAGRAMALPSSRGEYYGNGDEGYGHGDYTAAEESRGLQRWLELSSGRLPAP